MTPFESARSTPHGEERVDMVAWGTDALGISMKRTSLTSEELQLIRNILYPFVKQKGLRVFFFGSRVDGTSARYSDVDIGIEGGRLDPYAATCGGRTSNLDEILKCPEIS